ncbi:MAG: hypothetical protein AAB875_00870 [Patescibacteria group bacterium]
MIQTGSLPLIRVQNDAEWIQVPATGRFSVPMDLAASPEHLQAATLAMQGKMMHQMMVRENHHWNPRYPFKREGPLPHIEFTDDMSADPGRTGRPKDPRDLSAWEKFDKAEQTRLALDKAPDIYERVDFRLHGVFWKKSALSFHQAGKLHNVR